MPLPELEWKMEEEMKVFKVNGALHLIRRLNDDWMEADVDEAVMVLTWCGSSFVFKREQISEGDLNHRKDICEECLGKLHPDAVVVADPVLVSVPEMVNDQYLLPLVFD